MEAHLLAAGSLGILETRSDPYIRTVLPRIGSRCGRRKKGLRLGEIPKTPLTARIVELRRRLEVILILTACNTWWGSDGQIICSPLDARSVPSYLPSTRNKPIIPPSQPASSVVWYRYRSLRSTAP